MYLSNMFELAGFTLVSKVQVYLKFGKKVKISSCQEIVQLAQQSHSLRKHAHAIYKFLKL